MIRKIEDILEDAENGLSMEFRQAINVRTVCSEANLLAAQCQS
jgi:hypothetical protein